MIKNGQLANAENYNAAFASKQVDNELKGKLVLDNEDELSGPAVEVQKDINDLKEGEVETNQTLDEHEQRLDLIETQSDVVSSVDPAITDDISQGYGVGASWYNTVSGKYFSLVDQSVGAALWVPIVDPAQINAINQTLTDYDERLEALEAGGIKVATTNPGSGDDSSLGFGIGAQWFNRSTGNSFTLIDASIGAAVWVNTGAIYLKGPDAMPFNNVLMRGNSTSPKTLKSSNVVLSDADVITGLGGLTSSGLLTSTGSQVAAGTVIKQQENNTLAVGADAILAGPTKPTVRLTGALTSLSAIDDDTPGRELTLINHTGASVTIKNNAGAAVTRGILTGTKADLTLTDEASIVVKYDGVEQRWMIIGGSGSGGGSSASGGGSLSWDKIGGTSPVNLNQDGLLLEGFENMDEQEIFATVSVPLSYVPGKQIHLIGGAFFINSTTGKVLFKVQSALLKSGSTVLGSYPNTRISTNLEANLPGVANTLTEVGALDVTDSNGNINGVAVAGGDKIRLRLYRNISGESVSASATAKLLINNLEMKFN